MRTAILAVLALLGAWSAASAALPDVTRDRWRRIETPHFVFYTNGKPRRVERLARELERLNQVLAQTTSGMEARSPLPTRIFMFDCPGSMAPYSPPQSRSSADVLGYFTAPGHVQLIAVGPPANDPDAPVLYHEFLHSFLVANLPGMPLWLAEGIAEFYATFRAGTAEAEIGRANEMHLGWLQTHRPMDLRELFAAVDAPPPGAEAEQTFYSESWALTHMLVQATGEGEERFADYLGLLARGVQPERALHAAYGPNAEDSLAAALRLYIEHSVFPYRQFRFPQGLADAPVRTSPLPPGELLAELGELLLSHKEPRVATAREHLAAALALDSLRTTALVGMGRCADLDGRPDEAQAWYGRAMRADTADALAPYFAGRALVQQVLASPRERYGHSLDGTTPEPLRRARALLARSLELKPEQPEALVAYARTFLCEWGDSVGPGLAAVQSARALYLPTRPDVLVDLVALSARAGELGVARAVVRQAPVPAGDAEAIHAARLAIFAAEAHAAHELLGAVRQAEAESLLRVAVDQAEDDDVRRRAGELLAEVRRSGEKNDWIDRYNQGVASFNAGRYAEALEPFQQVAEGASDAKLRQDAAARVADTRAAVGMQRAAERVRAGDLAGARAVLDGLLQLPLSEPARASVRSMRQQLARTTAPAGR